MIGVSVVVVGWIEVLTRCRISVIFAVGVFDLSQVDRSLARWRSRHGGHQAVVVSRAVIRMRL